MMVYPDMASNQFKWDVTSSYAAESIKYMFIRKEIILVFRQRLWPNLSQAPSVGLRPPPLTLTFVKLLYYLPYIVGKSPISRTTGT